VVPPAAAVPQERTGRPLLLFALRYRLPALEGKIRYASPRGQRQAPPSHFAAPGPSGRSGSGYDNAIRCLRSIPCGSGYYRDGETGLYHVRNRYYQGRYGLWPQRDPIGHADGINLYEYLNGQSVLYPDPFGLEAWILHTTNTYRLREWFFFRVVFDEYVGHTDIAIGDCVDTARVWGKGAGTFLRPGGAPSRSVNACQ
jgi:RHS repeat-associated protein